MRDKHATSFFLRLLYGLVLGAVFFTLAMLIGWVEKRIGATSSIVGTSIVLGAQPAAVATIFMHYNALSGALISILGNLIPIPALVFTSDEIIRDWKWFQRKLQRAEKWSDRYEKYGLSILLLLSPVLGTYVCIGLGYILRWKSRPVVFTVIAGMAVSTLIITYVGQFIPKIIVHYF